jgi:hypothetical protein
VVALMGGENWQEELALLLRELRGAVVTGRKLLDAEIADGEAALVMRFQDEGDVAALTAFMNSQPGSEQGRTVQGILRRAVALHG